jgi:hypothetical protein
MSSRKLFVMSIVALALVVSACAPAAATTPEKVVVKETVVVAGTPRSSEVVDAAADPKAAGRRLDAHQRRGRDVLPTV